MQDEKQIIEFHNALCGAIGHKAFRMGMHDQRAWSDFLYVLQSLDDTDEGPLTSRDIVRVVNLMRKQRAKGAGWSLRYSKILSEPETFRDLVLEIRRPVRPRAVAVDLPVTHHGVSRIESVEPALDPIEEDTIRREGVALLRKAREDMRRRRIL